MGKSKSWFYLNHDWITHNDLIWKTCDLIWIWFEILWFYLKSFEITCFHNTMLLRVIDERRRPCFHCFVVNPLSISNRQINTDWNSEIKNYLELAIIGVCKTVVIFAIVDSYYVNWTCSKIWHFGKIDLWFDSIWTKNDLDLIWLFVTWFLIWGFDLNHFCKWFVICTCDLICDLPITVRRTSGMGVLFCSLSLACVFRLLTFADFYDIYDAFLYRV